MDRFFKNLNGLKFIQIGANDGVYQDPVRKYIKHYGWKGVLVEPQKDVFQKLIEGHKGKKHFANIRFENSAISTERGKTNFYIPKRKDRGNIGSLALMDKKLTIANDRGLVDEITVNCITFDDLLDKYSIEDIDVLVVDAEGFDDKIIMSVDFNRIKPKVIKYEHRIIKTPVFVADFLHDNGYEVFVEDKLDAIAIRK